MKYIHYITLVLVLITFQACEDVIDVPLDAADPIITVDAWIDNRAQDQEIILSWSQSYFDSTFVQRIEEAEVTLTNSNGSIFVFDHRTNGRYIYNGAREVIGQVGDQFTLDINVDGINISAISEMNRVPAIDSIEQELMVNEPFIEDGVYCNFFATDPAGSGDTYWIKTFKDGRYLNRPSEINIAFDSTFDGGIAVESAEVFIQPIQDFNNEVDENFTPQPWLTGEVITVEIHAITNRAFGFMELVRDQLLNGNNGIFAEPLANTTTNLSTDSGAPVLGFFSVAAVSSMSDTIR